MKKRVQFLFILFAVLVQHSLKADEGMWMPHQIADLHLENSGLLVSPQEIYKKDGTGLMNAIVSFGGGTGSFVSREGLILTNHHVAFGALQRTSDENNDYLNNGFLALSKEDELPAHGLYIDILLSYEEITDQMFEGFNDKMSDEMKYKFLEKRTKEIIADAEHKEPGVRIRIAKTFGDRNYYLYRFRRLRDIRIVYAPPIDLGKFGGEIDNWIWPRHTADFTFFRAYISPEGVGAEYHSENVPYSPKSYLKVSLKGFREGDFSFVMGYPGKTYRNDMLSEFLYSADLIRAKIDKYQLLIDFYENSTQGNRAIEIKYASKIKSLHNTVKNYQGKLEGFEKENVYRRKTETDEQVREWISNSNSKHYNKKSLKVFQQMEKLIQQKKDLQLKMDLLTDWISSYSGPNILYIGHYIYRTVFERDKPDIEREANFQERNFPFIVNKIEMADLNFDLQIDQQFYKMSLEKLFYIPADKLPGALNKEVNATDLNKISEYVAGLYRQSDLIYPEKRIEMINLNLAELEQLDDPFISRASEIESDLGTLREARKLLNFQQDELTKLYSEILIEKNNNRLAPDANGTIRFTFGKILGYSPADGIYYLPQTSLGGTVAKNKRVYPFNVPEKIVELYQKKDFGNYFDPDLKDVPACFLNTTNVTGGNSGSPTLNAAGELIGLIFDMTYESIIGDYYIISDLQRTISADIRYILFVTDKYANASHIIRELEL